MVGKIFNVVEQDLYIDIGLKFPVVCSMPKQTTSNRYNCGTNVRVLIKNLELSEKFLGFDKEFTILEANGVLLGTHKIGSETPKTTEIAREEKDSSTQE